MPVRRAGLYDGLARHFAKRFVATLTLPLFSNLFAVHDPDPSALETMARDLEQSGEFAEVWQPACGWIVVAAPLPGGKPNGNDVRQNGLLFAEGQEIVQDHCGENAFDRFREIADLTDKSPDRLESVPGDFGFIRFRPTGTATVVRSCAGAVPFYFHRSGQRTAIGTRLGDFVRFLPDEPRLDPMVNAIWAKVGLFPQGRTFLKGISILKRGHFARIEPGRQIEIGSYWNPRPKRLDRPTKASAREHSECLRALLIEKLTRDLDPEGGNLLTLSGGVDSSALAALAAGTLGRKVSTWSILPKPEPEFQHEMSYIEPLMRRFQFERSWIVRYDAKTRIELCQSAPRIVFHVSHPALCAVSGIQREFPVRVLFGGEFADQVCGSVLTLPDWLAHTSLRGLVSGLHSLPFGPRTVLRWAKHRLPWLRNHSIPFQYKLLDCVHPQVQEEYREWMERRRREAARDPGPWTHLALETEADGFIAMQWEVTSALGIRRSFPFFNREVFELAYRCHPAELIGRGPKKLLRAALRHDVPEKNLFRPDKGRWGSYLRNVRLTWETPLPRTLEAIVRPDWYPKPTRQLDLVEYCFLSRLAVFWDTISARRLARNVSGGDESR